LSDTLTHLINGEAVSAGTHTGESINPSNLDDVVARYPKAGAAEVNDAVQAARAAFPGWSQASPEVRSDVLDKASNIIMSRAKELGTLLSREEGKTLPEGTGEVMRAARILKYFAGEALRRHGQTLDSTRPSIDVETHREAVGAVPRSLPAQQQVLRGPGGVPFTVRKPARRIVSVRVRGTDRAAATTGAA